MGIKVLVAEDEKKLNHLICSYLRAEGYEAHTAYDGKEAIDKFFDNNFSLVILDIMMPNMDGITVCKEIRAESPVPIVMLTARNTEFDELRGFESGADEYISKPFSPKILITRINSVLKRTGVLQGNDIIIENIKIQCREHNVYVDGKIVNLTPKEYDLLNYFAINKNILLSRDQILTNVWGYDYEGDERTVDTHIKCIRAKLGTSGELIKTIRKYGYKLEVK